MVCNMVLETFPGFQECDNPKWPIKVFIYVVLKGSAEKAKKLQKPQATPASALTGEEQAAWRDLRWEAEAEGSPKTLNVDNVDEVNTVTGNISELQIEPGVVHAQAPIEPPAGAAHTRPTTLTPTHTPESEAEPVMVSADLPAHPPTPVRAAPCCAATPLDPAPPTEPTPPMTCAPICPTPRVPPTVPAEPVPPVAKLAHLQQERCNPVVV
ncbi:hypothetical protein FRC06_010279 [Ceratobasidium sp. 370]|nr:hypothetical protein FRC06_010279 [Ceratobasidium sp. 370]